MKLKVFLLFLVPLCFIPGFLHAQAWSGILDPSRATDWTQAGIPGGVPNYTTICQTVPPSGRTDSTDMNNINSAIVSCGATAKSTGVGQVVQLQAGTYTITNGLTFNGDLNNFTQPVSNVVLRGAGPNETILKFTGVAACGERADICLMGSLGWVGRYPGSTAWTGDNGASGSYAKGDSVIDVGSTTGLSVGQIIALDQLNDSFGICPASGGTGHCAGVSGATESGTTVTITTSMPHGYTVSECVGIGDVGGNESTTAYNSAGNTSGSCTENGQTYTGWFQITAVPSATTFQYTASASGLSASGGGYSTTDTGGVFISNVNGATINEESALGRTCPDASGSECSIGEISTRAQAEFKRITAISGTQLTVDPPIEMNNWRSSQSPGVWWTGNYDQSDGVEALTLDMTNDGGESYVTGGIVFYNAYESWAKNVRSINGNRNHVWLECSARIEVVDSYFFGTKGATSQSYGVEAFTTSDDLIQNNICQHVVACVMNGQSYGSVFAYSYMQDAGYGTPTGWMMPLLATNHDYAGMDLFEVDDSTSADFDNIHGTGATITLFRNRLRGQDTPIATNPGSLVATVDPAFNRAENYVGNILGTVGAQANYQNTTTVEPDNTVYSLNVQSEHGNVTSDSLVSTTLLRWGNYDVVTGAVRWCGNSSDPGWSTTCSSISEIPTSSFTFINGNPVPSSTTLPASFYLSSQPAFWQTPWGTPPWPAIGPDVTGGTAPDGVGGYSYAIPAQLCYINSGIDPAYQQTFTVTGASWSSGTATVTINSTASSNPLAVTDTVTITGVNPSGFSGTWQVSAVGGSSGAWTFQFSLAANPGSYVSGGSVNYPNILNFNAATCYPGDYGSQPAPPTNLNAIPH